MKRWVLLTALLVVFWSGNLLGADLQVHVYGRPDAALDKKIRAGLDLTSRDKFSQALRTFEEIKRQYPDHPVGYFLVAATLEARMAFYMSDKEEAEFTKNCEKAIELGEAAMQRNPGDTWNLFFTGGSYGTLGTFQGRYKRYLTSFRNGMAGVDLLKQVYKADGRFADALYGVGVYTYWSSKLSKLLWWMPGVGDKREEGIAQLRKAAAEGSFASVSSATNLVQILNLEGRYDEAAALAQQWLARYPDNRALTFGLAEAYWGDNQIEKAEALFESILDVCDAEERNNHVQAAKCHYFLARISERNKTYVNCMAHCRRVLAFRFNENELQIAREFADGCRSILDRVRPKMSLER